MRIRPTVKTIRTHYPLVEISLLGALLAGCAAPQQVLPVRAELPDSQPLTRQTVAPVNLEELRRVQAALLPPLVPALGAGAIRLGEPRFDLRVNNAFAPEVYQSIVSGTRYSVIVHPEVTGNISVNLSDVSVEEALQLIRETFGYEYQIEGNRITILPVAFQTRVFRVNYLTGQRTGSSETSVISAYAPASTILPATRGGETAAPGSDARGYGSQVRTTTQNDFWSELNGTLQAMIGSAEGRRVVVNPMAGIVVVRALPGELRQIERYLNAIRNSVQRQVVLEAKIVEVTLNQQFQNGIDWGMFSYSLPGPGPAVGSLIGGLPGGTLVGLAPNTQDFDTLLRFLESQGKVQVLSSQMIATLNNQKAVLKVGTDEYFVTGINLAGEPGAPAAGSAGRTLPSITVRPFFNGVALDITPQIDEDSRIILHIHPSVTAVTQSDRTVNLGTAFGPVTLPLARSSVSQTDSVVRVTDKNIVLKSTEFCLIR